MLDAAAISQTLAQPLTLPCGQVVKNRLLKSAMSETLGSRDHGPSSALVQLYRTWAEGGIGLSVTGNIMVDRGALGEPGNVVIEDDRDLPLLQEWAQAGKSAGGLIYAQLNHPGRQVPRWLNDEAVSPSGVPFGPKLAKSMAVSRALTVPEIEGLVQRFATAATVVARAGFDGVQLHGAHGYLVSQFLSPLTNQRSDAWGGSADGRRRFVLAVIAAMKAATPDGFGVAIKINSADFQRGGITEDESMGTIAALAEVGVDFVEVSGGTYEAPAMMVSRRKSTRDREAYFLDFAEKLRNRLDLPLAVTGGFRSGAAMAAAIDSGAVDLVGLARPLGIRPRLPAELLEQGDLRVELPRVSTGVKALDRMGMVELLWYETQLHRMGRGLEPDASIGGLRAFLTYAWENGLRAVQPRRGR